MAHLIMPLFLLLIAALMPGIQAFFPGAAANLAMLAVLVLAGPFVLFRVLRPASKLGRPTTIQSKAASGGSDFRVAGFCGMAYLVLLLVAGIRGIISEDDIVATASRRVYLISFILMTVAVYSALVMSKYSVPTLTRLMAMTLSIVSALNIFLWGLGVENPQSDVTLATGADASFLSQLGVGIKRVDFPLTGGVNGGGIASAMVLVYGLTYWNSRWRRGFLVGIAWLIFMLLIPVLCLLLSDSRGAALFAVVAAAMSRVGAKTNALAILGFLFAIAFILLELDEASDLIGLIGLGRDSSNSDFLTGRGLIWASVTAGLGFSSWEDFFGYGAYGHYVSGISNGYSQAFKGWGDNPELLTVHNGILQIIVDVGYVGLIAVVGFVIFTYRGFSKVRYREFAEWALERRMSLCFLNFLLLQTFSEVTLTPYIALPFMVLLAQILSMKYMK